MERYSLSDMLDHIQSFKVTELLLVPPILVAMAKHPSVRDGTCDISSVRKVVAGAAPIGMEVTQQFEELFKRKVKVRQAWGMSEYVSPVLNIRAGAAVLTIPLGLLQSRCAGMNEKAWVHPPSQ